MNDGTVSTLYIAGLFCAFMMSMFFSVVKIIFSGMEKSAAGFDSESLRYYASKIGDVLKNRASISCTVVVGKTLSNTAFAALAFYFYNSAVFQISAAAAPPAQKWGVPLAFSFFVLTLFAHYIPRAFAMRFYRAYAVPSYYIYSLLSWLLMPLSWFFTAAHAITLSLLKYDDKLSFLSDADKARITSDGGDDDPGLNEEEREMIRSIFDLSETAVDEIMVPRIHVIAADINSDMNTIMTIIKNEGHSRIPIYKDTVDQIVGILYIKDMITWLAEHDVSEWDLSSIVKKCHYVPMGKKINDLMRDFRVKHLHLAVVVDEYGGTAGIVTMEDILEEIVGDIQDEYDEEETEVVQIADNVYFVDPHIDLSDLNDELGISLDDDADYNTLSGLIYHELGNVPQEGTQLEHSGVRITIMKMDNQRIGKVKVEVLQKETAQESEPF